MKHLLEILKYEGYKEYRYTEKGFIENKEDYFSTMVNGGLAVYYVKNNDFNNPVIWGLHEFNKPPTLISPRPKILKYANGLLYNQEMDDVMNLCLQKELHQDIFKAMFDKSIVFKYE
jgi:hypothetical protein